MIVSRITTCRNFLIAAQCGILKSSASFEEWMSQVGIKVIVKGQLISKCLLGVIVKTNEIFLRISALALEIVKGVATAQDVS